MRLDEPEAAALALSLHGTEDPLLTSSWSARAAARTGGEVVLFEYCGQWSTRTRPGRIDETVAAFL